jgi:hypothetical protein
MSQQKVKATSQIDQFDVKLANDINTATAKATPVDADKFGYWDSVSGLLRNATWANIKGGLNTYFAGLFAPLSHVSNTANPHTTTLEQARTAGSTLAGTVDFAKYKAIALSCDNGATAPASPATGQWFLHTPNGRKILLQYTGTSWQPIISLGSISMYVDYTNGTDALDKGGGITTNAFKTLAYAISQIPPVYGGNVTINLSSETHTLASAVTVRGKFAADNYSITITGAWVTDDSGNFTSQVTTSGATLGTFTDTTKAWTVNQWRGFFVLHNNNYRAIISNTADTLTYAQGITISGTAYSILHPGATISGRIDIAPNMQNISFTTLVLSASSGRLGTYNAYSSATLLRCQINIGVSQAAFQMDARSKLSVTNCALIGTTGSTGFTNQGGYSVLLGCLFYNPAKSGAGIAVTLGSVLEISSCYFDGWANGVTANGSTGSFNSSSSGGYNYHVNASNAIVLTDSIISSITDNQYSGNTLNIKDAKTGGELLLQQIRDSATVIIRQLAGQTSALFSIQNLSSQDMIVADVNGGLIVNEQGSASADFRVESDTESNMIFLDANGDTNGALYLGGNVNGIKINVGGEITFIGSATRWDDLRIEPNARTTGAKAPTFATYKTTLYLYDFDNAAAGSEKEIFFTVQLPHAWKEGSTIYPHVHWVNRTAGTAGHVVRWGLEWTKAKIATVFGATTTQYGTTIVASGDITVADSHLITSLGSITMTGDTVSTVLICRLFRNSSDSADTYTGTAGLLYIDFHIELDSFGSAQEYIK